MTASSCSGAPGSGQFAQYCTEWRGRSSCSASRLDLRRLATPTKDSERGLCSGCSIRSQLAVSIPGPMECEDSGLWQCAWSTNIVSLVTIYAGQGMQDHERGLAVAQVLPCTVIGLHLARPVGRRSKARHHGRQVGETLLLTRSRQC